MAHVVEFQLHDSQVILIEVENDEALQVERAGRGLSVSQSAKSFEQLLSALVPATRSILKVTQELEADDIEIEFGAKLSVDSSLIIAKAAAEANFRISLKWNRRDSGEYRGVSNAAE